MLLNTCLSSWFYLRREFPSRRRRRSVSLRLEELEHRTTPSAATVVPQQFTTNQYTSITIGQSQLLAGDSGSAPLQASGPTQPANATLVDNQNGTFTFTPNPSFSGSTTFQYTVSNVVGGFSQTTLITAGSSNPEFGNGVPVALSGDTAVIGANFNMLNGPNQGIADVFVRSGTGWSQQAQLSAADGAAGDSFGDAVAISGDTLVIGANNKTVNGQVKAGAAYVFVRSGTTWSQQTELTAADGAASVGFGAAVALSVDTAVIEAPNRTVNGHLQGTAYVFVRANNAWSQQAELTAPDHAQDDYSIGFGNSVSVSGDTVAFGVSVQTVVSDPSTHFEYLGAVYVFVRSGSAWSQQAEITSPDGAVNDQFGYAASVSNDTLVIGQPIKEQAYVYVRSGNAWSQQAIIIDPKGATDFSGYFGGSVSVDGDTAVIGYSNGEAFAFARLGNTWSLLATISNAGDQNFGSPVAVSGDTAVIGGNLSAYAEDLGLATATATVEVNPATAQLVVSPVSLPTGAPGDDYASPTFTASGGTGSGYTFQESGILPPGVHFDPTADQLVGSPTQTGAFPGIVIAASDGHGGSGSETYTLTIDQSAFVRSLYQTVLHRNVESDYVLNYWENILIIVKTNPQQLGLPAGTDPFFYVAQGFWESQEHRWDEVESYYHDFLGRDLDLNNAYNLSERQYWTDQFFNGLTEADVIRGFLTSPEYLFKHQTDASLANSLNTYLLGGAATAADLQTWTMDLSALDAQRATLQKQTFGKPEDYKAQLAANLGALDDQTVHTGVLFDMLTSHEYEQPMVNSFYVAFVHRAGTSAEVQSLLALRDAQGRPLGLGAIAEMMLSSPEYRTYAINNEM